MRVTPLPLSSDLCAQSTTTGSCRSVCVFVLKNIQMCTGDNTLYVQYVRKYIYKLYRCFLVLHYLHISSVPLVLHWCWIGEHFCKHFSQTLCALHTSHCTLLASLLQNPVCSSNRRHFSYATLPFTILTEVLPERETRMRLLTNEKDLWEKVQQSWEFSKGG